MLITALEPYVWGTCMLAKGADDRWHTCRKGSDQKSPNCMLGTEPGPLYTWFNLVFITKLWCRFYCLHLLVKTLSLRKVNTLAWGHPVTRLEPGLDSRQFDSSLSSFCCCVQCVAESKASAMSPAPLSQSMRARRIIQGVVQERGIKTFPSSANIFWISHSDLPLSLHAVSDKELSLTKVKLLVIIIQ